MDLLLRCMVKLQGNVQTITRIGRDLEERAYNIAQLILRVV
jgi:hypothetical protein